MIAKTKQPVRLTGASLALMVALALGAGPGLAAQEKGSGGCLDEAVEDLGGCLKRAKGFWAHVGCGVVAIVDAFGCSSDAVVNAL